MRYHYLVGKCMAPLSVSSKQIPVFGPVVHVSLVLFQGLLGSFPCSFLPSPIRGQLVRLVWSRTTPIKARSCCPSRLPGALSVSSNRVQYCTSSKRHRASTRKGSSVFPWFTRVITKNRGQKSSIILLQNDLRKWQVFGLGFRSFRASSPAISHGLLAQSRWQGERVCQGGDRCRSAYVRAREIGYIHAEAGRGSREAGTRSIMLKCDCITTG